MNVGILGSGDVGKSLAKGFVQAGHAVKIGTRQTPNEKLQQWIKESGFTITEGTYQEVAAFGEILVIATLGNAVEEVINAAGKENFKGKLVIDVTNPLDIQPNQPPKLSTAHSSNGELVQSLLPDSHVVKSFNIVGNSLFVNPQFAQGDPDMLVCGNDEDAKKQVTQILQDFGWKNIIDIGGIDQSHYMEALCILWVDCGFKLGNWHIAFKLLRD